VTAFTESVVEDAALAWLEDVGWPLRCGVEARIGTLTAGQEWFKPWRTISGEALAPATMPQLQVLIEGVFEKRRLLHLIRDSLVFEGADGSALVKKMAECHQFHAVQLGGPRDAAGRRAAPRRRSRRRGARTLRSGPQGPVAQKPRAGAIFRGAAGRGGTAVPKPSDRDGPGDRGADRPRERHAPGERERGRAGALGRRDRLLRCLETSDRAVKVLGEPTLTKIARELVATVRKNVTIDWIVRENVRPQLRVLVERILRKHGHPPDKQEKATQTVLEQAEVLSEGWAVA